MLCIKLNVALTAGKVFKHASVTHDSAQMTALQLHVAHISASTVFEFLEIQWNRNLNDVQNDKQRTSDRNDGLGLADGTNEFT